MKIILTFLLLVLLAPSIHAQNWTWKNVSPTGYDREVIDFSCPNDSTCYVIFYANAAGAHLKTTNYGRTWTLLSRNGIPASGAGGGIHCFHQDTCFLTLDEIYYTNNGGQNWSIAPKIFPASATGSFHFISRKVGYVSLGQAAYLKTIDGGLTWNFTKGNIQTVSEGGVTGIWMINEKVGFIGSENGSLHKTTDSTDTWQRKIGPKASNPNGRVTVAFQTDSVGFCIITRQSPSPQSYIYYTIDQGNTWLHASPDSSNKLGAGGNYFFQSRDTIYYVGGFIYKSVDRGKTWVNDSSKNSILFVNGGFVKKIVRTPRGIYYAGNGYDFWRSPDSLRLITGLEEYLDSANKISLFPNPAVSKFTFSNLMPVDGHLFLHDLNGTKVLEKAFQGSEPTFVRPEGLPNGVYLYTIEQGQSLVTKGLIFFQ
jgi:photosystem II stability/assembly factor-like uncharacterized protein